MAAAVYPGAFDPPTVAHLAVAEAAWRQCGVDRVDLCLSRRTLGKDHLDHASLERRLAALRTLLDGRPWLGVNVTDASLLVDAAEGYDVLVLGADKWAQVLDPAYYGGSAKARDDAVPRLPCLAVAPRGDLALPPNATVLDVPAWLADVSSTAVRAGRREWAAAPTAG